MKIKKRISAKKGRKMRGFRHRMKNRSGRAILANRRRKKKNISSKHLHN